MLALPLLALAYLAGAADSGCVESQPCYTAASIANSAANVAGYYAPNSFLSIYGTNLSYVTGSLGPGDISSGGQLPASGVIQGTEVLVLLNNTPGYIYYVSPGQVNVLIPELLIPGTGHRATGEPRHLRAPGADHADRPRAGAVSIRCLQCSRHPWQRAVGYSRLARPARRSRGHVRHRPRPNFARHRPRASFLKPPGPWPTWRFSGPAQRRRRRSQIDPVCRHRARLRRPVSDQPAIARRLSLQSRNPNRLCRRVQLRQPEPRSAISSCPVTVFPLSRPKRYRLH